MSELTREQLLMAIISGNGPAYLRGVDLSSADLSKAGWLVDADLRHANLSSANLSRTNLRAARMEKANLHAAHVVGADLEGADLGQAKLDVANLRMANLRGANLREASLVGTNLMKANLTGANLEGADLEGANLAEADLGKARLALANLKMANLRGANLEGANLVGTILDQYRHAANLPMPSHNFSGSIKYIQLTDLIQLVCLSDSDLLIQVESPQGHGTIHVRSGCVYHAQVGAVKGEEAFFEMLEWANGRFETFPLPEQSVASIDKPLEHLLLESMRQRDERRSSGQADKHTNLVQEIKKHMPIPAYPSKELMELICKKGKEIDPSNEVQINDAFDSEDAGSILCSIVAEEDVFIAPLNYITIKRDHPLFNQIAAYQSDNQRMMTA
jgi:uncharacterized protein YjbI with pentapeptide repeats